MANNCMRGWGAAIGVLREQGEDRIRPEKDSTATGISEETRVEASQAGKFKTKHTVTPSSRT